MSDVSEIPISGHLSNPEVNTEHMADVNKPGPVMLEHAIPSHSQTIFKCLREQQAKGDYCDVILHANDQQFYAHRCVLATCGSFFHSVFTENQTNDTQYLSFPSTSPHVLKSILDFMYSGRIEFSFADADELLALCSTLEITSLQKLCCEALEKHIDISNWYDVRQLASKHTMQDLLDAVLSHLSDNFAVVYSDEKMLNLHVNEMLTVCKTCNVNCDKDIEKMRLQLIWNWINRDFDSRELSYAQVMQTVNPDNLDSETIQSLLDSSVNRESGLCDHFVTDTLVRFVSDRENHEKEKAASELALSQETTESESATLPDKPPLQISASETDVKAPEEMKEDIDSQAYNALDKNEDEGRTKRDKTKLKTVASEKGNFQNSCSDNDAQATEKNSGKSVATDKVVIIGARTRRNKGVVIKVEAETLANADEPIKKGKGQKRKDVGNNTQVTKPEKGKRGRPRKTPPVQSSPVVMDEKNEKVDIKRESDCKSQGENASLEKPLGVKAKAKRARKKKTCSTQTATDGNEEKPDQSQAEVFPPVKRRPRSKRVTPDTPRLSCPKCPRTFPTDCQLRHHMKGHGSDTPFLCDTCGFTTRHFGSMNVHRKLHDTSQMLSCTWPGCSYKAIRKSRLEDHLNMHTGSKIYMCSVCGKGFSGRKHLHRHEKLHVDTKPFKCDDCDYASVRKDKLKDHIKKHHPLKALDKGWLSAADAAKVKPSTRHRTRSSTASVTGQKARQTKRKSETQPKVPDGKSSTKNSIQFENLVQDLLKTPDQLRRQEEAQVSSLDSQKQQISDTRLPPRPVIHINKEVDTQTVQQPLPSVHALTVQTQQQVQSHELSSPQLQIVQSPQISPQLFQEPQHVAVHTAPQTSERINSQTVVNVSQGIQPQPHLTARDAMQNHNSDTIPGMATFSQGLPRVQNPMPTTVVSHPNAVNSSTLSEEVYQFITHTGHSAMPSTNNEQLQSATPMLPHQTHADTLTSSVTNVQPMQQSTSSPLGYTAPQSAAAPQNEQINTNTHWR